MTDRIRIARDELFDPKIDEAIARERALTQRRTPPDDPVSPLRRLLLSSSFYLPVAGALASLLVWLLLEPGFHDNALVSGQVTLVNQSPFAAGLDEDGLEGDGDDGDVLTLTVGTRELLVATRHVKLEPSEDGRPAFSSLDEITPGVSIEVAGEEVDGTRIAAMAIRPLAAERVADPPAYVGDGVAMSQIFLFPLTAVAISVALILAEGVASCNWVRTAERGLIAAGLTLVFSFLAYIPAGLVLTLGNGILSGAAEEGFVTVNTISGPRLIAFAACRSAAWAAIGAACGLGMNLVRSTRVELRNSVVGGALGGALGGVFFDPVQRFFCSESLFAGAAVSRAVGLVAVGACVGWFVALVDRLAREAWLRVRTGPLAGKSFVIWRSPTTIGSSPRCDVYLFKDAEVEGEHARFHRVGNRFEIEDQGSRAGTAVGGRAVRRHRLQSGDQIVLGGTVLEFEERSRQSAEGGG